MRKLRLASSRCSAGELVSGFWDRAERPRVRSCGRAAMMIAAWAKSTKDSKKVATQRTRNEKEAKKLASYALDVSDERDGGGAGG